jgi:transposase
MVTKMHGIDRHLSFSTISLLDRNGMETNFIHRCHDLEAYCKQLGPEDAVAVEMSSGVFHLADMIEATGAKVCVVDPRRFKIISESKDKTDKNDARRLARGLYSMVAGTEMLPTVYKPDWKIRNLRRLFGVYIGFQKQITALKNGVQGYLRDIGVTFKKEEKAGLFSKKRKVAIIEEKKLNEIDRRVVEAMLEPLFLLVEKKESMEKEILSQGAFLQKEVELLLTIRGMSPILALAFLADVGDIRRFRSFRRLNAYLGVVPSTYSSAKKMRHGRAVKESRWLTRTLFTQAVQHFIESSPALKTFYTNLVYRRGVGRARIAVIRKMIGIIRRMLLNGEIYRTSEEHLTDTKIKYFRRRMAALIPN